MASAELKAALRRRARRGGHCSALRQNLAVSLQGKSPVTERRGAEEASDPFVPEVPGLWFLREETGGSACRPKASGGDHDAQDFVRDCRFFDTDRLMRSGRLVLGVSSALAYASSAGRSREGAFIDGRRMQVSGITALESAFFRWEISRRSRRTGRWALGTLIGGVNRCALWRFSALSSAGAWLTGRVLESDVTFSTSRR